MTLVFEVLTCVGQKHLKSGIVGLKSVTFFIEICDGESKVS